MRETLALCDHCYLHIPAIVYEKNNEMFLEKTCADHGTMIVKIEADPAFYFEYNYRKLSGDSYMLDVTRKCNLLCTHCYQVPYNFDEEKPISYFTDKVKSWPAGWDTVTLSGAEAFLRKDFFDMHREIKNICNTDQKIIVLTNGVILANTRFAKSVAELESTYITISLHHQKYHSSAIRKRQLTAIDNCKNYGIPLNSIVYTLNGFHELPDILTEIQEFKDRCLYFGINLNFDTGISPGTPKVFLSQLVNEVKDLCKSYNFSFEMDFSKSDKSHCVTYINGVKVKLTEIPDVHVIDMSETYTACLGDFFSHKPPSQAVHQIILRDAYVNKNIELKDTLPEKWRLDNDKRNWRETIHRP